MLQEAVVIHLVMEHVHTHTHTHKHTHIHTLSYITHYFFVIKGLRGELK